MTASHEMLQPNQPKQKHVFLLLVVAVVVVVIAATSAAALQLYSLQHILYFRFTLCFVFVYFFIIQNTIFYVVIGLVYSIICIIIFIV